MDMISKLSILKDNGIRFITFEDFKEEFHVEPFKYGKELFLLKKDKEFLICFNENIALKRIFKHYGQIKSKVEKEQKIKFFTK